LRDTPESCFLDSEGCALQGSKLIYSYDRRDVPVIGLKEQPQEYRNVFVMKLVRGDLFA